MYTINHNNLLNKANNIPNKVINKKIQPPPNFNQFFPYKISKNPQNYS